MNQSITLFFSILAHCGAQKSAASDPNTGFSATTVEVTKRKLEDDDTDVAVTEHEISNNSTTKKSKNDENISISTDQQQFSMRLPPTAKSGLCQQRAREQLVFQKKENKQKKLFEWVQNDDITYEY